MGEATQAQAAQIVKDLRACASEGCKRCSRSVGYGCARNLKRDAAAMIEKLKEEKKWSNGK